MNEPTRQLHVLDAAAAAAAISAIAAAADAATAAGVVEDIPILLDRMCDTIVEILGARVAGVLVAAHEDQDKGSAGAGREAGELHDTWPRPDATPMLCTRGLPNGNGEDARGLVGAAARWFAAHRESAVTPLDGPQQEGSLGEMLSAAGCRTLMAAPLAAGGETWGLAFAGLEECVFEAVPRAPLLGLVAQFGGLTLSRAWVREQAEQQRRQSDALYRVSLALTATRDIEHLLSLVVRLAADTVPKATNGVLHLLDEQTGELRPRALSFVGEVRPDAPGRSQMRTGHGVAGLALERGLVINVPDVAADPRFLRVGTVRRFASMLVAPLLLGERRIGTLSVDSPQTHAFSEADEHLLLTLATQAAAAIENARLVGDLQQSLDDLKRTQEQLIQSEKLSAIGQLIAGVAHELNNPLTAIMGYAQLLQTGDDLDEGVERDLAKIHGQAQRAARIVQNLLTFARQQQFRRDFLDMNDVIERTVELRAYQLRVSNVQVHTRLSEQTVGVLADASQMQQVLLNLINNAHDAIKSAASGGSITIVSRLVDGMVQVRVSDDGPGLAPEVRKHLFEPFFTTKEVGKGTGLGLSICFGIVGQHDGRIWAEGEPGEGATFVVELPAAVQDGAGQERLKAAPERAARGGAVLLVEDEEEVASPLQRFLVEDGHQVSMARDGKAALERIADLRRAGAPLDLIVSDMRMPGLDGPTLYEHLRREDPGLAARILFITGDTLSAETSGFLQRSGAPCLAKPFTVEELRRAIDRVLSA